MPFWCSAVQTEAKSSFVPRRQSTLREIAGVVAVAVGFKKAGKNIRRCS